jgi:hypothetical protein
VLWELRAAGSGRTLQLVDYFEDGGQGLLVTEYLAGGELFSRCSRRDYRFTESKCKVSQAAVLCRNPDSCSPRVSCKLSPSSTRRESSTWTLSRKT